MSTSVLDSAREALIECCTNTKEGILEFVDWFRMSSRSVYEKVAAKLDGNDRENNEVTPHDQSFIAGRVQSRRHIEMRTGRSTACRVKSRRRSEMPTGPYIADNVQSRRRSKMPTGRYIADKVQSRRLCEISTGSERESSEQIQSMKLHVADSFVTTKTEKMPMQSKPEQHTTRVRSNTLPSRDHGNLNSMPFSKHKKQTLDMVTTEKHKDRNFVKGHSDWLLSNIALKKMKFHEYTTADEMRERLSTMPSMPSRQSYTNEQSLKCNVLASFNLGLNKSKQGSKTETANSLFRQKSTEKIITHPKSQPDSLNRISELSFFKKKSGMRRTQSVQNEDHFANNSSYRYHARFTKFGDVRSTSVDPKKKLDPCEDFGYDPSTIVPSVNFCSSAAAEENKPHFQKLRSIVKNIHARKSLEEISFNKVKALCHNRKK
ncbi:hypothetical protein DPMN_185366 [Dreissena polymorpha]|uniref:Uncharacterized protein n=1 Tax=Dreissena polymorpha TaxID=45954 RepID=A0A9D4DKC5_DREPO|nr:hypothetical protein DPMN_185366 [Dreissena polymorpha]